MGQRLRLNSAASWRPIQPRPTTPPTAALPCRPTLDFPAHAGTQDSLTSLRREVGIAIGVTIVRKIVLSAEMLGAEYEIGAYILQAGSL